MTEVETEALRIFIQGTIDELQGHIDKVKDQGDLKKIPDSYDKGVIIGLVTGYEAIISGFKSSLTMLRLSDKMRKGDNKDVT